MTEQGKESYAIEKEKNSTMWLFSIKKNILSNVYNIDIIYIKF